MKVITQGESPSSNISKSKLHYGWIVVVVTFLTLLVSAGIRSAPGVLMIPMEEHFGWDRTVITFALAINLALYGLCGPFAAALFEVYGVRRVTVLALLMLALGTSVSSLMTTPWQLTLLWGLIVGLGTGFTSSVLGTVVANRWFTKRRGLVVGILSASGATGQLVFLPLFARLVQSGGWSKPVWVTAFSALVVAVLVLLFMRNTPADNGLLPYGTTESPKVSTAPINPFALAFQGLKIGVRSKDFLLLAGSFFVCGASTNGLIGTHFIPASMEKGMPEVTAASMLAIIGIFDIVGTTSSGWLSDRYDNRWLLFWYYGLRGLSLLILPYALGSTRLGLIVFIVFYGLDWVATVPPTVKLSSEVFGEKSSIVFGWIWAAHQLGAATAAFGGGALHTWLGDYQVTFMSAGILCLLSSGLVIRIKKLPKDMHLLPSYKKPVQKRKYFVF
jgi:MFS family permease